MSIIEVARVAGVSTATVSRVLNDFPGVREETVRQVRAAVEELQYKPQRSKYRRRSAGSDPIRLTLRTGNIAVLTIGHAKSWLQLPVLATVLSGIHRGASSYGLSMILDELVDLQKLSPLVEERRIDGAVVFLGSPISINDSMLANLRQRIPIVWCMGMGTTPLDVDHIAPDNIGAGHLACSHLLAQGCHEVACLTADTSWPFMRQRAQAFMNAAADMGVPAICYAVGTDDLIAASYGNRMVIAPTLEKLVSIIATTPNRPQGLFVLNDATTAAVYPLLQRHGVLPARDIKIISCDNEAARLGSLHPRPASIELGAEEIGFRAVVRLISRIQRPADPSLLIQVMPRLTVPDVLG